MKNKNNNKKSKGFYITLWSFIFATMIITFSIGDDFGIPSEVTSIFFIAGTLLIAIIFAYNGASLS